MDIKGQIVVITGIKRFKGDIDGKKFDATTVYVETDLNEGDNSRGSASVAYKLGDSILYEKLLPFALPLQAKVDIRLTTNGNKTTTSMKLVEVINQPQKKVA